MRAYLISDNVETWVGMRLAGIEGTVLYEKEDILEKIKKISSEKDVGIILITETAASLARKEVDDLKIEMILPLIAEIPDRHGTNREKDRITGYIKESIGIKI
ncbi:V-type ATP synthase subunit F [Oxobacter pfennigii]|uniref:V-type ATP synthase subunit F n=1 Tax=Oxobacter pfennigii TaxID=36849 RepID=A0A0P8W7P3_9CLOT|nr:V-type ATP synthase subunit F [Oxobacter pfennigii]KPU43785.1 V-type ATP synthase subunit F [Oxobacter pfennigii]